MKLTIISIAVIVLIAVIGFFIPIGSDTPKLASALFGGLLNSYS